MAKHLQILRSILPLALTAILTTGLVACATPEPEEPTPTPTAPEAVEEDTAEANGDFVAAEWAAPVTNPGDLLGTISGPDFQVDVYQVGTIAATTTGQFADPTTNEPIIDVGDELVFVNYVVTNTGSEDIPLSFTLVDVTATYGDWPYLQGMDSVVDFDLDEAMEINRAGLRTGVDEAPFIWEPGTSYSYGENFLYQSGSPIVFDASLTPADQDGDLIHDENRSAELATTIK